MYLCPACGETDADGVVLAPPAPQVRVGEPVPTGLGERPSAPSFAAPPPPAWIPPGAPVTAPEPISSGPPRILVVTISVLVLLQVAGAALSRDACSFTLHAIEVAFLLAVLSGKVWARTLGLVSAMLGILGALFVLAIASRVPDVRLVAFLRGWAIGSLLADGYWIYVLFRRDVTTYFARSSLSR